MDDVNRSTQIQIADRGHLIVVGASPHSSPQTSPSCSRPTSARVTCSSRPSSAGERSSIVASFHQSHDTSDKRQLQRLKVHEQRKERRINNLFSDPIIQAELGRCAEESLKEDGARVLRQHIHKVGGRFSRLSFRRPVCRPEIVSSIINDFPPPRPSFAPLNSFHNIVGLLPQSSQEDVAATQITEPPWLGRIAARPEDIKSTSLHHVEKKMRDNASHHHEDAQRPISAASRVSSFDGANVSVHSTSVLGDPKTFSQYLHIQRPETAHSQVPLHHSTIASAGLCLAGGGLSGRTFAMSGQGRASRSAYVTAGEVFCQTCYHFYFIFFSSPWNFSNECSVFISSWGKSDIRRRPCTSSPRGKYLHSFHDCSAII
jgi:hypothetical protein